MAIAASLHDYLASQQINFHLLKHRPTPNLLDTARAATLSPAAVARALLLRDGQRQYWIALIGSDRRPDLDAIASQVGQAVTLCQDTHADLSFGDCHPGVIPPFGKPYNLPTLVDQDLLKPPHVYVEDGDPTELLRLEQGQFRRLVGGCQVAPISVARHH